MAFDKLRACPVLDTGPNGIDDLNCDNEPSKGEEGHPLYIARLLV